MVSQTSKRVDQVNVQAVIAEVSSEATLLVGEFAEAAEALGFVGSLAAV